MRSIDKRFKKVVERNNAGEVTVIHLKDRDFRTLIVSGKISLLPLANAEGSFVHIVSDIIQKIGRDFLRLFPFLSQSFNSFILSYEIHKNNRRLRSLTYEFTYTINGSTNTDTAILLVLNRLDYIATKFNACMKSSLLE